MDSKMEYLIIKRIMEILKDEKSFSSTSRFPRVPELIYGEMLNRPNVKDFKLQSADLYSLEDDALIRLFEYVIYRNYVQR